jgi:hypothetical protein
MTMDDQRLDREVSARLARLASAAPDYDPTHSSAGSRRFGGRTVLLAGLVAASVVAGAAGLVSLLGPDDQSGQASCAKELTYDGARYVAIGDIVRMPAPGGSLPQPARREPCDDGNGAVAAQDILAATLPGADPAAALVAGGDVWVNVALDQDPPAVEDARRPLMCTLTEPVTVKAEIFSLEPELEPRFDGDVRAPYTAELRSTDRTLALDGYDWVMITASGEGSAPDEATVRQVLYDGKPAAVTLECAGDGLALTTIAVS